MSPKAKHDIKRKLRTLTMQKRLGMLVKPVDILEFQNPSSISCYI